MLSTIRKISVSTSFKVLLIFNANGVWEHGSEGKVPENCWMNLNCKLIGLCEQQKISAWCVLFEEVRFSRHSNDIHRYM